MNKHKLQKQITRNKIFDSTATLVMTFGYSSVNVTKIVTHAKISRGTFYQHFIDIRDVFEQMNDYILKQLEMLQIKFQKHIKVVIRDLIQTKLALTDEQAFKTTLEEIYRFLYENRVVCSAILTNRLGFDFNEYFMPKVIQLISAEDLVKVLKNDFPVDYYISHSIYSHVGFIKAWFERDFLETPKELSDIYYKLLLIKSI
ncbi:TetR/AcrR family transcriptional regulator [Lactococcus laudensis]|uniref:TetR/AcrR family transcriptional regulator n=1 Tax=Pseudolactococcus laudensis TaxID=1494461 RepID=UPI00027751BF|nr:putative transcriptional regulator [Lactococcus raffinolactis 4877]